MNKTKLPIFLTAFAIVSPTFGQTFIDDFESYSPGVQSANLRDAFTIVDGSATIGSGQAAEWTGGTQTWHGLDWDQGTNPKPVLTVSFDIYNPSTATEASPPSFAFNNNGSNPVSSTRNIVRFGMDGFGGLSFAGNEGTKTYADQTYPLDTLVGFHLVFNNTASSVTYPGGRTLAAQSLEAWKVVDGALSLVGTTDFAAFDLDYLVFGTNSSYSEGDLQIDNMRYSEGVTVVPEPSTYAMVMGFLALVGMLVRRRMK
ncbi:MAG: PEP-CTERM sorting domain-containing protein [Spirochaetaceae bacterium]|nr:PEP-CTERM sorting domain-containing protein [Spirochaetaceae bacterium]